MVAQELFMSWERNREVDPMLDKGGVLEVIPPSPTPGVPYPGFWTALPYPLAFLPVALAPR